MKSSNVALERLTSLEWADGRTIGIGRTIKIIVDFHRTLPVLWKHPLS